MKKVNPRTTMKLISATSVAIFSLAAVFTATGAWFQSRRNIENANDDFAVQNLSGNLGSVTFHHLSSKVVDADDNALEFTFDSTPAGTITYNWNDGTGTYVPNGSGNTTITLNQYDPMNRNQPLLLMFHLGEVHETTGPSIRINGLTNATGFLGERDETNHAPVYSDLYDSDIILSERSTGTIDASSSSTLRPVKYYWLSSVVQFQTLTFPNDSLTWRYATTSAYATANSLPLLVDSPDRFVDVDNDAEESSFHNAPNLFSSGTQTIKNIGLVIDYYPDAIEYIYSTYLANEILEDTFDGILNFLCDWSLEVI